MKKLFFLLIMPFFLFAQEQNTRTYVKKSVQEHLDEQLLVAKEVIANINNGKYPKKEKQYTDQINYLSNKIDINKRENNIYAVRRDELEILILEQRKDFKNTLKKIIEAKKSLKDRNYFIKLIKAKISDLENMNTDTFSQIYKKGLGVNAKIINEFKKNYETLLSQTSQYLFTLRYLLENINAYRPENFFIDHFNLEYFIKLIDSNSTIAPISQFTSYYLNFSVGEIIVVLFIVLFFRLLNTKIITLLTNFVINTYEKKTNFDEEFNIRKYIKKSLERPLVLTLYILSFHISLYILVKDVQTLEVITPWINTVYMALFILAAYSFLSNSISNYAQNLVEKYPNVRKEMIVFILRIIKVILILIVILFLFTQLGIDIKAIAASLGVGGIAIALASKDTLANFFGSLNIMTDNSFSQGDWIIANDVEGTVVDIRMRTTRIRTFDNAMITIPNSQLANTYIKNYSKRKIGRRIKMKLGITYESKMSDIVNLKNDIYGMLHEHPYIATEKNATLAPLKRFETIKREDLQGVKRTLLVYIDEYGDSSINILIYCFTRSPSWEDWLTIKEDVLVKINTLVVKNNCDFAYPTQTLHLKN